MCMLDRLAKYHVRYPKTCTVLTLPKLEILNKVAASVDGEGRICMGGDQVCVVGAA
jgi:hypothetical protein